MIKKAALNHIRILLEPKKEFSRLKKRTLETIVGDYFIMLLSVSALSGLFNFCMVFINAFYLDFFLNAEANYWAISNYFFGKAISIVFLYLFVGSFIIFCISMILRLFVKGMKYTELLKVIMCSASPLLLLSWIPQSFLILTVWSIALFILGVRIQKGSRKIAKDSILYRD